MKRAVDSMFVGKIIRLQQIMDDRNRSFIIAVDQFIPRGLHPALKDPLDILRMISKSDCNALLLHSGLLKMAAPIIAGKKPFIIKLSTSTTEAKERTNRVLVDTVEHALLMGASGVAINVYIGSSFENAMLENLRDTVIACDKYGMPLIVMINPMPEYEFDSKKLAYVCRIGAELGADIIKTDFPGSIEEFKEVVEHCPLPVLIEESPLPEDTAGTLKTTKMAIQAGGAGVMYGSRVWGHHDPILISRKISEIINDPECVILDQDP